MLQINNLQVDIQDEQTQTPVAILRGVDLTIPEGEVHAIMGPNGSGKSTLASVLAGRSEYQITHGVMTYDGTDLFSLSPEDRARRGLFLGFQYPIEIPGVNNMYFLRESLNSIRKFHGETPIDAADFMRLVKDKLQKVGLDESFLQRSVNDGFSGGEKKRNEILQMLVLEPKFIILDEVDSGLDIDALARLAACVNSLRSPKRAILLVTHYERLLEHIRPDVVHVMAQGRIIKSGDMTLARQIEQQGYATLLQEAAK